ncbi:MAG TPA: stage II sporulation protein P [Firmicutes bacterium]|nr:stage II sporulation protein P [Bacillota bacterium]
MSTFYREALKAALPGFNLEVNSTDSLTAGIINNTLISLVQFDPFNPKTIISSQISGLRNMNYKPFPEGSADTPPVTFPTLLPSNRPGESLFQHGSSPGIIIYHAHTTETFNPTAGENFTTDLTLTVARLAAELKKILEEEYGIPVLHNYKIHDIPRSGAYQEARKTVKALLRENPGTRIVVDLHRDGVPRGKTTVEIGEKSMGRIMMVVGTNYDGWEESLKAAEIINSSLEKNIPGLSKGIKERNLVYNQDVHPVSLLIEVGGHQNTLEEVLASMPYLARALADLYVELQ